MRISCLSWMLPLVCLCVYGCQKPEATSTPPPVIAVPGDSPDPAGTTPSPPRVADVVAHADTTPVPEEALDDTPPEPSSPEALVAAMQRALQGVLKCPRAPGGVRVANPSECLRPLQTARNAMKGGKTPEEITFLQRELSRVLVESASREEPTLVLYALKHHQADFGDSPEARAILNKRMNDFRMDIAVAAAAARLHHPRTGDPETVSVARDYLLSERPDRLRAVACQYMGSAAFSEKREHFELLTGLAGNPEESALVRGCAARHAGTISRPSDLRQLSKLLEDPVTQSDAAWSLVNEIGSPKAFSSVLKWLAKQARKPTSLQASTLSRLLPENGQLEGFPLNKLASALQRIVTNPKAPVATRLAAVETFSQVKTREERQCRDRGTSKRCASTEEALGSLLKKIERSTTPSDLRVRTRLSRARAEQKSAATPAP